MMARFLDFFPRPVTDGIRPVAKYTVTEGVLRPSRSVHEFCVCCSSFSMRVRNVPHTGRVGSTATAINIQKILIP